MAGHDPRFAKLLQTVGEIDGSSVRVGVINENGEVGRIATIHEFGAPRANIPERSFIRATLRERREEIKMLVKRLMIQVIKGTMPRERAMELLGAFVVGAIKGRIVSGPFAPLKPATIARKGSSAPLIDTGQLKNSVSFVVID